MAKKKGNNYIINVTENIAKLELQRRGKDSVWTIIDLEDLQRVLDFPYTWFATYHKDIQNFYVISTVYKEHRSELLHQFIMNANGNVVDHINNDTLDNRKSNLRIIPDANNSTNRKGRNKNNKSGYRNVSWNKDENRWVVQLQVNGKNSVLAKFPENQLEEAGKFAELLRQEYYGEYAGNA